MELVEILRAALRLRASDIHLSAGGPPMARADGEMVELPGLPALTPESCKALVYSALYDEQRARFERDLELDCSFAVDGLARFRMNVLVQRQVVEAVLRVVPVKIPSPDMIGLGPVAMGLAELPRGLVLVTGPAGCGKSTTLACMLQHVNERFSRHIVTIEDPVEFLHPRGHSLIRQREVGRDTRSFQEALRHALRQDPDIILVGELRDLETIALAITAAETGHLCFATLHTSDAAQSVDRIIDVFPPAQQAQVRAQLAGCLRGVIAQVLVPRRAGKGRIAAREMMLVTPGIATLIREGKTHMIPNVIETSGRFGMYSLDKALAQLVRQGVVTAAAAAAVARSPERLSAFCAPVAA